jgi:WS/DGAT/MGAT family acyltransferase
MDVLFIAGENDRTYHHTAGLVTLDTSATPQFDFDYFRRHTSERMDLIPHFRWKLQEVPLGLDLPYWVEDENFSYDNHFKRIAVPQPGDREALAEVASYIFSRHLDRSRPLWEMWYIEGLAGGRVAILQKLHHCMMDGQGMQKVGELLSDFSPRGKKPKIESDIARDRPGAVPDQRQLTANMLRRWLQFPLAASRGAIDILGTQLRDRLSAANKASAGKPDLCIASFNGDISGDRGFVFGTVPLAAIKRIKDAFGATVNDVVLALVAGTLRDYLLRRDELPDTALRCSIAVSLRTEEDSELSNRVTNTAVTLATDIEDPIERLRAISAGTAPAKQRVRSGGKGIVEILQILPPVLLSALVNSVNADQGPRMLGANLIISNVRGSSRPMYIAGARLECMYPISILTPGMGLNITCVSYCDGVDFGFSLAPELFDQPWDLVDGLSETLDEYLELIPAKGSKAGKPRAAAVNKATGRKPAKKVKKVPVKRKAGKKRAS